MEKEKALMKETISKITYVEGQMEEFYKQNRLLCSYRVYKDGFVGIYCQNGFIEDEQGYQKAEANLVRERAYPYGMETGQRTRNKAEKEFSDKELKTLAEESMNYLKEKYADFVFNTSFEQRKCTEYRENSKGMNYSNTDCCINVGVNFKHKDSTDLMDGYFSFSLREYDPKVFCRMADDYLGNFHNMLELPEELIIDTQYYGFLGQVTSQLHAERLALGTSLLAGKIGQQVFSEDFTLSHDVSDQETWFNTFWDGEGHVMENDKLVMIENGRILSGYSDRRCAEKYHVPYTGNAYFDYADVPGAGGVNARIKRSEKTVKELLNGRYAIVMLKSDGWFNDKGEIAMPVGSSLLTDGEKILGRLPAFTFKSNMYDMFGKDFIGVGSDQPIFNDKQLLFRVHKE